MVILTHGDSEHLGKQKNISSQFLVDVCSAGFSELQCYSHFVFCLNFVVKPCLTILLHDID